MHKISNNQANMDGTWSGCGFLMIPDLEKAGDDLLSLGLTYVYRIISCNDIYVLY